MWSAGRYSWFVKRVSPGVELWRGVGPQGVGRKVGLWWRCWAPRPRLGFLFLPGGFRGGAAVLGLGLGNKYGGVGVGAAWAGGKEGSRRTRGPASERGATRHGRGGTGRAAPGP